MATSLKENLILVCSILNKHSVQYLVVGGTAVALHGYFRFSTNHSGEIAVKPDVDIWYNATYDNYYKLPDALNELGQDVTMFKKEKSPNPQRSFFKFELSDYTLDLLPELKSLQPFRISYANKILS